MSYHQSHSSHSSIYYMYVYIFLKYPVKLGYKHKGAIKIISNEAYLCHCGAYYTIEKNVPHVSCSSYTFVKPSNPNTLPMRGLPSSPHSSKSHCNLQPPTPSSQFSIGQELGLCLVLLVLLISGSFEWMDRCKYKIPSRKLKSSSTLLLCKVKRSPL